MNNKAISFIKSSIYTLSSNLFSLIVSTLVVLIIPKLIGVQEYGFWQLYLFYSSYVGFLHFGWNDGIYLRYGGKEYHALNKNLFHSQFIMLLTTQILLAIIFLILSNVFINSVDRLFIISMVSFVFVVANVRHMLLYILQATNRINTYAHIIILDKAIYVALILMFPVIGVRHYKFIIIADLIGKFVSLLYAMFSCRDIVFIKLTSFYFSFNEAIENINVGAKLMFANIAGMLIIGIVRYGIERSWDVATFGKVSLTLSVSNMAMIFISALGIVMFPALRRSDQHNLPIIYAFMRDLLMTILLGALVTYYPLRVAMADWLPQYSESILFMSLLMPIFIYEGKMALLINTYFKTMREEKLMLKINFVMVGFSLVFTLISTRVFRNLELAVASIMILVMFRSVLAEVALSKLLNISVLKDIMMELMLTTTFILLGWFINSWYTMVIYLAAYMAYVLIKRKDITKSLHNLKSMVVA